MKQSRFLLRKNKRIGQCFKFFSECGFPVPKGFNPPEWIQSRLSIEPGKEEESRQRIELIIARYEKSEVLKKTTADIEAVSTGQMPEYMQNLGLLTEIPALLKRQLR